jgi:hypothetical protein
MRFSDLKPLLLLSFLFLMSSTTQAVIIIPSNQTVTLDYYEAEPFELSENSTLNVLPGGSAELFEWSRSSNANLNILGGEIRKYVGGNIEPPDITMTDGYIEGIWDVSTPCSAHISGGRVGQYGFDGNCDITIIDGLIEGQTIASWDGTISIFGGTFQSKLGALGGGFFDIYGGKFEIPELVTYHSVSYIDFYGHGLTMSDPLLLHTWDEEKTYNTQVTGYLSDGNFIDMSVTYITYYDSGGVTLHNVPEPSTLILLGAGHYWHWCISTTENIIVPPYT